MFSGWFHLRGWRGRQEDDLRDNIRITILHEVRHYFCLTGEEPRRLRRVNRSHQAQKRSSAPWEISP
ncbi:MAG TPA: hypothetical protein DCP92_12225 [Nitrospiraceae bacterium]|nr:hypothetical protein [Nitrospiraceae bacterium]